MVIKSEKIERSIKADITINDLNQMEESISKDITYIDRLNEDELDSLDEYYDTRINELEAILNDKKSKYFKLVIPFITFKKSHKLVKIILQCRNNIFLYAIIKSEV